MSDKEVRRALDEIAGKSKDLLASLEEIKKRSDITLDDLKAIREKEKEIIKHTNSIIRQNERSNENL